MSKVAKRRVTKKAVKKPAKKRTGKAKVSDSATLIALEKRRCEAIEQQDWSGLSDLLDEKYRHVHTNGHVDGKQAWIDVMKAVPKRIVMSRGDLNVIVHGNAAIMIGLQGGHRVGEPERPPVQLLEVWVKRGRNWRLASCQSTPTT